MSAQRIILVNTSRLLGDMLRTIIYRTDHLEMVGEVCGDDELPPSIETTEAEWMLMTLASPKRIPGWVDQYLSKHPSLRILVIFPGSSTVRLMSMEEEEELEDLSLNDLIHILQGHPLAGDAIGIALQFSNNYRFVRHSVNPPTKGSKT